MSRATSTFDIVETLRALRDAGPRERIPEVFERHYVEAWYGFEPRELHFVLDAAPEEDLRRHRLAGYVLRLLSSEPGPALEDTAATRMRKHGPTGRGAPSGIAIVDARLRGELQVAMTLLESLRSDKSASNALVDSSFGAASFTAVQSGTTRMLAGDLRGALADFERVKWTDPPADLVIVLREAHAKSALVHALLGDPDQARRELDQARRIPRTRSWAEPQVDAAAHLAENLLHEPGAVNAVDRLLSVPRRDIGEMWPFYVLALAPPALDGDNGAEQVLSAFGASGLHGAGSRQGLPGSIVSLVRAAHAARSGHTARARAGIASADPHLVLTRLTAAGVALDTGVPAQALALAIGADPQTRGLRQLEIWRLSITHLAHRALGESYAAEAALRQAKRLSHGLTRFNPTVADSVGDLIRTTLLGEQESVKRPIDWLTPREAEILSHIAEGLSRRQIAERLYVSMNTIKTHASNLYRKLGASSRDALLGEAYDRGLI